MRTIAKIKPENRMEQIASGVKISPENRDEFFAQKARISTTDLLVNGSTESGSLEIDKTYDEITAADKSGRNVRLITNARRYNLVYVDENVAQFTCVRWYNSKCRLHYVIVSADDTIVDGAADFTPSSIPG